MIDINSTILLCTKKKISYLEKYYEKLIEITDDIYPIFTSAQNSNDKYLSKKLNWNFSSIVAFPYKLNEYFEYFIAKNREYLINKYEKIFFSTYGIIKNPFSGEEYIHKDHFLNSKDDLSSFDKIVNLELIEYIIVRENLDIFTYF